MKLKIYFFFLTAAISVTTVLAQPVIGLQKTIGGGSDDVLTCMFFTKDSSLIIGGYSNSNKSGNKLENSKGGDDFWMLLLNRKGGIRGQKIIGGSDDDVLNAADQTTDGGYILGGYSRSNGGTGDKTENNRGVTDYWIVKLDSRGNIQWDKTIGGSGSDELKAIKQTSDGGYIAGGTSYSGISGEKSENPRGGTGDRDFWVVKLDSHGTIEWDKTVGGSETDYLKDIIPTKDGGYLLGGYSYSSISGEKTDTLRGLTDYWIVKLDNAGQVQWDKTYGGFGWDELAALAQTSDDGYLLGGTSTSLISGEKMQNPRGGRDYWLIKTDNLGQIEWSNTYGGSNDDFLAALELTSDGGFILSGDSKSGISGEKTENRRGGVKYPDYWILKLNSSGTVLWDKTIGGNENDISPKTKETGRNRYTVAGTSSSGIGGDKTEGSTIGNTGNEDYWLVEVRYSKPDSIAVAAVPNSLQLAADKSNSNFTVYPNPAKDVLHINTTGKASFSLTDQSGKKLLSKNINGQGEINIAHLPAGIYYVQNTSSHTTQKIQVLK